MDNNNEDNNTISIAETTSPSCPRCGSENTKFCYYNNYSLTQPRYFCKGCRRYWTKGGSLRNVPIGGGCRKTRRPPRSLRLSALNNRGVLATGEDHCGSCAVQNRGGRGGGSGGDIDLALVYANYLNQDPDPGPGLGPPESLASDFGPCFKLPEPIISDPRHNPGRRLVENSFGECSNISGQVGDTDPVYFWEEMGPMDDWAHGNYGLPPLPGDKVGPLEKEGTDPVNDRRQATPLQGHGSAADQESNVLTGNWGLFDLSTKAFAWP